MCQLMFVEVLWCVPRITQTYRGQRRIGLTKGNLQLAAALAVAFFSCANIATSQTLRVGAARVDITPKPDPANPPSGKYEHERLYVRAIVIDNGTARAALIGADQGGLSEGIWSAASKQIAAELNCPVANVLMSATHTHSAPFPFPPGVRMNPNGPPPAENPNQPPPPIVGSMVDAVRQAKANLQPARVGYGTGFSYLNVNRDAINPVTHLWTQGPNLDGPSDKTVAVLKFDSPEGAPIAVYVTYAMHPVNGYLSGIVSADFPGAMSGYIEQAYGEKVIAVFAQNASGDQNPLYLRASTNVMASRTGVPITGNVLVREEVEAPLRENRVPAKPADPKVIDQMEQVMQSEGILLGEEVIRVMTNITRMDSSPRIFAAQNVVTCPGRHRLDSGREGAPGKYEPGEPVHIRLGVLRIGDVALASVNAEIFSPIGVRLKAMSPLADTMPVTLANGRANSGYIPDDAAFVQNTFQVISSQLQPGCAEDAIDNGLVDLIQASDK
jgi:neutral ceramidase